MPESVQCPYYNGSGYCKLTGGFQTEYHKTHYCLVERDKGNDWRTCANYQGASEKDRIEKR